MKFQPLLLLAATLFATSCGTQSTETTNNDSTTNATTNTETTNTQPVIEDPDPTDTIPAGAYTQHTFRKEAVDIASNFLSAKFKDDIDKGVVSEYSRKFAMYEYDLNADGQDEIFVGLTGPYFCGSGGCSFYILDSKGNELSNFSVSDYPVIVSDELSNGYKDLIINSKGTDHLVKFNGKTYPSNPSVQPVYKETPSSDFARVLNMYNEPYPWFKF